MKSLKNKKGFTIVELVIVIAVIGILAAVLIPTFSTVIDSAKKSAALQDANAAYKEYVEEHATTLTGAEKYYWTDGTYTFCTTNGKWEECKCTGTSHNTDYVNLSEG